MYFSAAVPRWAARLYTKNNLPHMSPKFGVLVFPGSNCDHDAFHGLKHVLGVETRFIWHKEGSIGDVDVVIVPGGFSYGDYLRSGAIARFSPVMADVVRFAGRGGLVLGICNGFQVLCEAGLLPGALLRNASLRFVCRSTRLRVETVSNPFTSALTVGQQLEIPVAHGDGNYFASEDVLDELEANAQVVFRYVDADGEPTPGANPNGSIRNIAGIVSTSRNVLGMMPHPERHVEALVGSTDGRTLLQSLVSSFTGVAVS